MTKQFFQLKARTPNWNIVDHFLSCHGNDSDDMKAQCLWFNFTQLVQLSAFTEMSTVSVLYESPGQSRKVDLDLGLFCLVMKPLIYQTPVV